MTPMMAVENDGLCQASDEELYDVCKPKPFTI